MECPTPIIFRPLKPPEPTRPGAFRAGGDGPSASLRDDSDNGTCPAMPMRGGAGRRSGAQARRASCFSFGPFGYAGIVTASTPAPRSPDFVRRARGRYGG